MHTRALKTEAAAEHTAAPVRSVCLLYWLYRYKSTNSDADSACRGAYLGACCPTFFFLVYVALILPATTNPEGEGARRSTRSSKACVA
jgi:hypothetical protein